MIAGRTLEKTMRSDTGLLLYTTVKWDGDMSPNLIAGRGKRQTARMTEWVGIVRGDEIGPAGQKWNPELRTDRIGVALNGFPSQRLLLFMALTPGSYHLGHRNVRVQHLCPSPVIYIYTPDNDHRSCTHPPSTGRTQLYETRNTQAARSPTIYLSIYLSIAVQQVLSKVKQCRGSYPKTRSPTPHETHQTRHHLLPSRS